MHHLLTRTIALTPLPQPPPPRNPNHKIHTSNTKSYEQGMGSCTASSREPLRPQPPPPKTNLVNLLSLSLSLFFAVSHH